MGHRVYLPSWAGPIPGGHAMGGVVRARISARLVGRSRARAGRQRSSSGEEDESDDGGDGHGGHAHRGGDDDDDDDTGSTSTSDDDSTDEDDGTSSTDVDDDDDDDEEEDDDGDGSEGGPEHAVARMMMEILQRSFLEAQARPPPSRGLPPSLIAALPVRRYATPRPSTEADETAGAASAVPDTCAICLEDFADGDEVRTLACAHAYHVPCIDRWLADQSACPCCRAPAFDPADPRARDLAAADPAAAAYLGVDARAAPPDPFLRIEPKAMPEWLRAGLDEAAAAVDRKRDRDGDGDPALPELVDDDDDDRRSA
jgi:hypothetical protein